MIRPNNTVEKIFARLFMEAQKVREHAHVPYSHFRVGAALLSTKRKIYKGVNVENASYGLTLCAERVAITSALTQGDKDFVALAIVADTLPLPCGACLQVMSEFFSPRALVGVYALKTKEKRYYKFSELLPHAFTLKEET